MTEFHLLHCL